MLDNSGWVNQGTARGWIVGLSNGSLEALTRSWESLREPLRPSVERWHRSSILRETPYTPSVILDQVYNSAERRPEWLVENRAADARNSFLSLWIAYKQAAKDVFENIEFRYYQLWNKHDGIVPRLVGDHRSRLARYAGSIFYVGDEAEDIVHEAILKLLDRNRGGRAFHEVILKGPVDEARIRSILYTKVYDLSVEQIRKWQRHHRVEGLDFETLRDPEERAEVDSTDLDPDFAAALNRTFARLGEMGEIAGRIVILRADGLSIPQIAERLKVPVDRVRQVIHKLREVARRTLPASFLRRVG